MIKFIHNKNLLQFAILLILVIGFNFYEIIELYTPITFFYEKMQAFAWFLTGIYFIINSDSIISRLFAVLAFNNLLDELIFNPLVFGLNEKILFTILIILSYHRHKTLQNA